ncbi:hypothetical protein QYE76_060652 [Lolium multiflorum]|uniref:C2H2-type domain-containing protein n=1 Tax=Lolium multiflorum TaxID=4521 RepID=A0AAD8RZN7_LOLMU|nr:hypothetical protein QYE76_060652 [Lolium multiflorum]
MGLGMKRAREEQPVSLALSLTTDSTSSCTTSADSAGAAPMAARKKARRGRVVATSGEGDFVCKTCGRAFATIQALGGHRTSHLRGRHGLELGVGVAKAITEKKRSEDKQSHECNVCGLGFETGQALGGPHEAAPRGDAAEHRRRCRRPVAHRAAGSGRGGGTRRPPPASLARTVRIATTSWICYSADSYLAQDL